MKTVESIRNIITAQSVESFRAVLRSMRSNVEQLDTIQSETVRDGGSVSESVRSYIKVVGLDAAVATVATLVNRDAWDGRISRQNSEWAASVEDAWDSEAALVWCIYSKMHKTHLDQFATELRMHGAEYAAETEVEEAKAAEETEQAEQEEQTGADGYTIAKNSEYGSIEIRFSSKPSEAIRDALKLLRFRWNRSKGVWYGFRAAEDVRKALENAGAKQTEQSEQPKAASAEPKESTKAAKIDRDKLRTQFALAWNSPKMIDYCTNQVAAVAELPTGELIVFNKQSIKTRFCFGESGYDYDEAQSAAQNARTSFDYFRDENMADYRREIKAFEDALTMSGRFFATINRTAYTGQKDDCMLRCIEWRRDCDVLNDLGGSAYLEEIPGQTITEAGSGRKYRVLTAEEIRIILDVVKTAAAAHEKKVEAYLKRYGTSKVHSWTYWRDA